MQNPTRRQIFVDAVKTDGQDSIYTLPNIQISQPIALSSPSLSIARRGEGNRAVKVLRVVFLLLGTEKDTLPFGFGFRRIVFCYC
ncbi:hypothetical protein VNO77_25521 [Canavalia gladiata]|uniref:Uncharacterized protein n=1 Tax=Canavalia gladiata TaxID=3824 RepID=A0AAN9LBN2_CANGL